MDYLRVPLEERPPHDTCSFRSAGCASSERRAGITIRLIKLALNATIRLFPCLTSIKPWRYFFVLLPAWI
jgi:hypothetical protein